jgi:cell division protein FtsZ
LRQGVQGISDLITVHGLINLDFADVKTVMSSAGSALMGIGRASGDDRAVKAAQQAVESPLLEVSIDGARGVLFNVIGGMDMSMHEINAAAETITAAADPDANIIFGATINPDLEGEIIITVVATGFDASYFSERAATPEAEAISGAVRSHESHKVDDSLMQDMDVELGADNDVENFKSDNPMPNIWSIDEAHEETTEPETSQPEPIVSSSFDNEDDELEKPSFLRRLKKLRGQSDADSKKDSEKDDSTEEKDK